MGDAHERQVNELIADLRQRLGEAIQAGKRHAGNVVDPYTLPPWPPDPLAALTRRVEALEATAGISGGWNGG